MSRDLRAAAFGAAAWAGALVGLMAGWIGCLAVVGVLGALLASGLALTHGTSPARRPLTQARIGVALLLVCAAVGATAALRSEAVASNPVTELAADRVVGQVELAVTGDPVVRKGRFGNSVVVPATLIELRTRGEVWRTRLAVTLTAEEGWDAEGQPIELGQRIRLLARLAPGRSADLGATVVAQGTPEIVARPGVLNELARGVRSAIRDSAEVGPDDGSALVPALVTGDDARLSEEVVSDFRTAGMTHLTAVSGTNLTLVLGFALLLARWAGVRGRGFFVVGVFGVIGFVLMARLEPSVIRAAAMGSVALLGLGSGGRSSGVRALGLAVLLLLLWDPWLGVSIGFALSVLATAGILFIAPGFRDALAAWMPRWLAEAVAVPLAAQVACTPLVAGISGQVSLVAVAANLVVAPAVGPATVLGLVGGLIHLVVPPVGTSISWMAVQCAQGIVLVAATAARLPVAAIDWSTSVLGLTLLSVVSLGLLIGAGPLLRSRTAFLGASGVLVLVMVNPLPSPGWPPVGWVLVMCDVGQGDAMAIATAPDEAVVVDAGPEPDLVDRCLRRLGVRRVPAVILTHFHADHVDGLPGVLRGRSVGELELSSLAEPEDGVSKVLAWAARAGLTVREPTYGERAEVGSVSWKVVGPRRITTHSPNDASVVLLVEAGGLRLLLTGDAEPTSQAALVREPGVAPIDVLKVPHHGSRYQDDRLLGALGSRLALISVGADNDYGHPANEVVSALEAAGAVVRRTDRDGDVAVVVEDGTLRVVAHGS